MIKEPVRMTAKAFLDGTVGVNAQLLLLTLDQTVAGVNDTRPVNIVSVKNQADHNIEVREADDENQFPLIVVCVHSEATGPGQVWSGTQDSELDVSAVLVMRGGFDALKFTNTDYYLVAMQKAIHQYLLSPATRDTNGTRNNIVIKSGKRMSFGHAQGSLMGGQVAGVLKITYEIRNKTP